MKNNYWTKELISVFKRTEELKNFLAVKEDSEGCFDPEKYVIELMYLESVLYIYNPYMIGHLYKSKEKGLYTYREAVEWDEYYIKSGKLFFYFPINYKSMYDYVKETEGEQIL